jgi:N-methylhydantoinase A
MTSLRIGIDIGGTFTDFVVYDPVSGQLRTFKLLSTPHDPAEAVLQGLTRIFEQHGAALTTPDAQLATVIHGSTVATNALLERKGAATALVTTRGFRDILQIGRQNRPALYDFFADPPPPLVPSELRFEVDERVDHEGNILQALDDATVEKLIEKLKIKNIKSIAVCLLFSFLRPEHEQRIGEKLRNTSLLVSLSSEIIPEYREYERTSTTVVNACVSPVMDKYLTNLESGMKAGVTLRVMQSNGGSIAPAQARSQAVRCILSGPAGGVVGCEYVGRSAFTTEKNKKQKTKNFVVRLITFDMGGTSTDVSLIDGQPQITTEAVVGGCPIRVPLLDIHTIGAGGGSIARVDEGGALRVGPESASADPGPACYGKGGETSLPTVTDANVVLGRIPPEHFLGGEMPLDFGRAHTALEWLGRDLGLSAERAALGVVAVANAHMERALRVISVERGHDPRAFTLLSFGGAGGLHAADLARGLGIPRVLIPPLASTLSAFGMLAADVVKDYTLTVMLPGDTPVAELASRLEPLAERGRHEILAEGISVKDIRIERFLDMRYRGQSYELIVPFSDSVFDNFHQIHAHQYGYANSAASIEVVNLRVRAVGEVSPPPLVAEQEEGAAMSLSKGPDSDAALLEKRDVLFAQGKLSTPLYRAEALRPGNRLTGPAVIVRSDTTILLTPSDKAGVDGLGNLLIEIGA